jgi:hypothetical protein
VDGLCIVLPPLADICSNNWRGVSPRVSTNARRFRTVVARLRKNATRRPRSGMSRWNGTSSHLLLGRFRKPTVKRRSTDQTSCSSRFLLLVRFNGPSRFLIRILHELR